MRQAVHGSLGLGELRTESTAKSVTGSDLCLSVSAQIPAVRCEYKTVGAHGPRRADTVDLAAVIAPAKSIVVTNGPDDKTVESLR